MITFSDLKKDQTVYLITVSPGRNEYCITPAKIERKGRRYLYLQNRRDRWDTTEIYANIALRLDRYSYRAEYLAKTENDAITLIQTLLQDEWWRQFKYKFSSPSSDQLNLLQTTLQPDYDKKITLTLPQYNTDQSRTVTTSLQKLSRAQEQYKNTVEHNTQGQSSCRHYFI